MRGVGEGVAGMVAMELVTAGVRVCARTGIMRSLVAHTWLRGGACRRPNRLCGAELRHCGRGRRQSCRVKTGRFCAVGSKLRRRKNGVVLRVSDLGVWRAAGAGFFRRPIKTAPAVLTLLCAGVGRVAKDSVDPIPNPIRSLFRAYSGPARSLAPADCCRMLAAETPALQTGAAVPLVRC